VLWIRDLNAARSVLCDKDRFRIPTTEEFVPGVSRSFFLATDTSAPADHQRFRAALAAAVTRSRVATLAHNSLMPAATPLARAAAEVETFDLHDDYVRPYSRRAAYALAGISDDTGAELVAHLKVAFELARNPTEAAAAHTLLAGVSHSVRQLAERGELAETGIPGHALSRGQVNAQEAVLLTVPILEMAALDLNGSLTLTALRLIAELTETQQRRLLHRDGLRAAISEAARLLDDLFLTRVATKPIEVNGTRMEPGDRLIIDVQAANLDESVFPDAREFQPTRNATHIAFGEGIHVCMGRELATTMAIAAVDALLTHGTLVASRDHGRHSLLARTIV
jgi:cytochrome P450